MQDHNYVLFTKQYDHKIISRCNCDEKVKTFDVEKEYKKFFKVKNGIMKKRKQKNNKLMFQTRFLSREEIRIILNMKSDNQNGLYEHIQISKNKFCKTILKNDNVKMVSLKDNYLRRIVAMCGRCGGGGGSCLNGSTLCGKSPHFRTCLS